jgi:WD40 repeat protein
VYDLSTWKLEHTLTAHSGPILALTVNGGRVVTTGADMTAAEWDPATWTLKRVMRNHDGAVSAAAELSGGEILTASLDGKLKVWGEDSGLPVKKTVPAAPAARTRPARRQMAGTASWPQGR